MNNGKNDNRAETRVDMEQIAKLLLEDQLILPHDLEFALDHQKYSDEPLGQILVRMGALSQYDLEKVLSRQGGNPILESDVLPPFVFS
jgi:hypothetical protein